MRHSAYMTVLTNGSQAAQFPLEGDGVLGAWGMRRLVSGYTTAAVKVERASDAMQLSVGFDAEGLFDADALSEFLSETTGSGLVVYDQSGNGIDLTPPSTEARPGISASVVALGGKPAVVGHASGVLHTPLQLPDAAVLIVAYADHDDGTFYGAAMGGNFAYAEGTSWKLNNGETTLSLTGGASLFGNHIAVLDWDYTANVFKAYIDGQQVADATTDYTYPDWPGTGGPGNFILLGTRHVVPPALPFSGNLAEAVLLEGGTSAAIINAIGSSMSDYYGLDWTDL